MIRDFEPNDIFEIEDLCERFNEFPIPNYHSPVTVLPMTVEHDNKIVGSAFVHLTCEIGLILDQTLSNLTRAKLIQEIFITLFEKLARTDLEDCHVFIVPESDEHYAQFLMKNFGFERDKGISLCLFKSQMKEKTNEQSESKRSTNISEYIDESGKHGDGSS